MSKFSEAKLKECLNDRGPAFNASFKIFKDEFYKGNQDWIHKWVKTLKKELLGDELQPMSKIHIIRMIKECFEIGYYPIVVLIEVELLPVLRQIGMYKHASTDPTRGKGFFIDQTSPDILKDTKLVEEYEKIGNSYLRFVLECIEVWAQIKPYYYFVDDEIKDQPSNFARVYEQMKNIQKVTFPDKKSYIKDADIDKAKLNFKNRLDTLTDDTVNYVDYYTLLLADALQKPEIFASEDIKILRRLQQLPDIMLVEENIKVLRDNLESKATPNAKIHSLQMISDMFEDGLLEVVSQIEQYLPHLQAFLNSLDQKETSLKRGQRALPVESSVASKYYTNLLKSLVLWSETVPKDPLQQSKQSKIRITCQRLMKKYEFPYVSDDQIKKHRTSYTYNSKRIAIINQVIAEQFNQVRKSRTSNSNIIDQQSRMQEFEKPPQSNLSMPKNNEEVPVNQKAFEKKPITPIKQMPVAQPPSALRSQIQQKKTIAPPIPKSIAQQHLQIRFNTLDFIYSYIASLTIATQNQDKQWLESALGYCQSFNNTYEEYMEANIEMSNFEERFDLGYSYLDINGKLIKIFGSLDTNYGLKLKQAKVAINSLKEGDTPGGVASSNALKNDLELMKVQELSAVRESTESKKKMEQEAQQRRRAQQEQQRRRQFEQQKRRKDEEDRKRKEMEGQKELQRQKELEAQRKRQQIERKRQQEEAQRKKAAEFQKQQRQAQLQKQRQLQLERQRRIQNERQQQQEQQRNRQLQQTRMRQIEEQKRRQSEIRKKKQQQIELQRRASEAKKLQLQQHKKDVSIISNRSSSSKQDHKGLPTNLLLVSQPINSSGSAISSLKPNLKLPVPSLVDSSSNIQKQVSKLPIGSLMPNGSTIMGGSNPSSYSFKKRDDNKVYEKIPNELSYKPDPRLQENQQNIEIEEQQEGLHDKLAGIGSSIPINYGVNNKVQQSDPYHSAKIKSNIGVELTRLDLTGIRNQNKTESKQSSFINTLNRPITPSSSPVQLLNYQNCNTPHLDRQYEHSQILEPNLQPLNDSFHNLDSKEDLKTVISSSPEPNFKNCFEFDKFLIPSKVISGKEKIFWLEQDAQVLNSINRSMRVDSVKASTSQGFYPKKSSAEKSLHASFVTLPELLAERSEKFDGELKSVQERHYKEVDILENKIRRLERELREKDRIVSEQKMEIMSMRDSVMSSRGFMTQTHLGAPKAHSVSPQQVQYLEQENHLLKSRLKAKQFYSSAAYEPSWAASSPMTPISQGIENSIQRYKHSMEEPEGKLFFVDPYQPYLSSLNDPKLKKMMLKSKQLLFQNEHIEIGAIISLDNNLKIALYIQSMIGVSNLTLRISKSSLKATWYPEKIADTLQPGKQERVIYSLELQQVPYHLPQLQFSYKVGTTSHSSSVTMPCSFNKFVEWKDTDPDDFLRRFGSIKQETILRGPQILYNKKLLKDPKSLEQFIPKVRLLNPQQQKDFEIGRANLKFGVLLAYNKNIYMLRVNIRPNQSLFFQGSSIAPGDSKPLQFLISTLNCLLSREKQWS